MSASSIRLELTALRDSVHASTLQRFFKTAPGEYGAGDRLLGIRVPLLRKLARAHDALPLREVSKLLDSSWPEERLLALLILVRQYPRADAAAQEALYRLYVSRTRRVNN